MLFFTDKFGFKSDDLDAITSELSRVLNQPPRLQFNDSLGGDYSAFGKTEEPGGRKRVYHNHFHDGIEPDIQEEDFPELGLILLIEHEVQRQVDYVDYEPVLRKMKNFEPVLLYRDRLDESTGKDEVLFDLTKKKNDIVS